jgi:hypothetical protein
MEKGVNRAEEEKGVDRAEEWIADLPSAVSSRTVRQQKLWTPTLRPYRVVIDRPGGWCWWWPFSLATRSDGTERRMCVLQQRTNRIDSRTATICVSGNYSGIRDTIQFLSAIYLVFFWGGGGGRATPHGARGTCALHPSAPRVLTANAMLA